MKKIALKNLPARLPLSLTLMVYLLYDKFKFDRIWLGAIIIFLLFMWIGGIAVLIKSKYIDIFKDQKD